MLFLNPIRKQLPDKPLLVGYYRDGQVLGGMRGPWYDSRRERAGGPGIVLRLSRNVDKQRGFVNGAVAVVSESLCGNAVFVARLVDTGNQPCIGLSHT